MLEKLPKVNLIKPGLEEWISQRTTTKKLMIYGLINAAW